VTRPKLPKTLRIGHLTYTVKADNKRCEEKDIVGESSGNECLIVLRDDFPHDTVSDTLLHEVLHQCLFAAGVVPRGKELDTEERWVRSMTGPLLVALRENFDLLPFLLGGKH
jgi:hypothetical protein